MALVAQAQTAGLCANNAGKIINGIDGSKYCLSPINMNWWSAFAWCDTAGYKLVNATRECNKGTGPGACRNFASGAFNFNYVPSYGVWTASLGGHQAAAYTIQPGLTLNSIYKTNKCPALCLISDAPGS